MSAHNKVLDFIEEVSFAEHPFVLKSSKNATEYDVTDEIAPFSNGLKEYGKFSNLLYCRSLLHKLLTLSKTHRAKFLEYQCQQMEDPEKWLLTLEQFIEANTKELKRHHHHEFIEHSSKVISETLEKIKEEPEEQLSFEEIKLKWDANPQLFFAVFSALIENKIITVPKGKHTRRDIAKKLKAIFEIKKLSANAKPYTDASFEQNLKSSSLLGEDPLIKEVRKALETAMKKLNN